MYLQSNQKRLNCKCIYYLASLIKGSTSETNEKYQTLQLRRMNCREMKLLRLYGYLSFHAENEVVCGVNWRNLRVASIPTMTRIWTRVARANVLSSQEVRSGITVWILETKRGADLENEQNFRSIIYTERFIKVSNIQHPWAVPVRTRSRSLPKVWCLLWE